MSDFVFDLTCDVTGDTGVNFFNFIWKISSRTLYCRFNFPVTSIDYWDRLEGGGGGRYGPPAEGRGRTRLSSARVNSMGSLYNLSYFVKSWYFPLKVVAKQIHKSVLFSHWLKNAAEILLHSEQNLREYPSHNRASARWLSDWAQTTSRYFQLPL